MRLRKKSPPIVSIDATADQADEADSPAIDVGVPDLLLEGSIDRMRLEHCIKQLPAGYRAIFVLHDIHGYQHNEIAEIVDRKSTRLNSSHGYISYAVFCLKKKKKQKEL